MATRCQIKPGPVLDLGALIGDSSYQFFQVADVSIVGGRDMAVVNRGSHEIRFFGMDGAFLGSVGGEGDGPGEFRRVEGVWEMVGDSLLAWDSRTQRFSIFGGDRTFVRSFQLSPVLMNAPSILGADRGQSILATDHFLEPGEGEFRPQQLYLLRYDWSGQLTDTLGTFPFGSIGRVGPPEDRMAARPFFEARTVLANGPGRIYVSAGFEPEIRLLDPLGNLVGIIRWESGDRQVTDEDLRIIKADYLGRAGEDAELRRRMQNLIEHTPAEKNFPSLQSIASGADGRFWVEEYLRPSSEFRRFLVFGATGKFECQTNLPRTLEVHEIATPLILGVQRDSLDVEHVVAYEWVPSH
jgi:hypothetical protein